MKQLIKAFVGTAAFGGAVGLAAPASANPDPDFFAAVRAAGVTGTDEAILEDGEEVCWELGPGGDSVDQVEGVLQNEEPSLTTPEDVAFVVDAYRILCPTATLDYWDYGTDASGGGGG